MPNEQEVPIPNNQSEGSLDLSDTNNKLDELLNLIESDLKKKEEKEKDNTEEISKRVRKIIRSKLVLQRRLLKAFPNIKNTINLDELIERAKSKIEHIKNDKLIK